MSHRDKLKNIEMEMLHHKLGHQSFQSLLIASQEQIWKDANVKPGPETHCEGCHIATRRKANRTLQQVSEQTRPGEVLFMDKIDNPTKLALVASEWVPAFLLIADAYSRFSAFMDVEKSATSDIISAIQA